ncbi:MAG: sugar-binding transcriptional regulator [Anaerolineaceae bacterium]|nr:sugar-binding transcriptional regulator [Anaerolineaceae bacterium]
MEKNNQPKDRLKLLAEVAEMYYLNNLTQAQIARHIGVTRSMISRMLAESRNKGIVKISIFYPESIDEKLSNLFSEKFRLSESRIFTSTSIVENEIIDKSGKIAADFIKPHLSPNIKVGIAWGKALSAAVDALEFSEPIPIKLVQLVGALGSKNLGFDGYSLVQKLTSKIGGEGFNLNAPYIVESPVMAEQLRKTSGIKEALELGKECDLALLGIGTTNIDYATFFKAAYLSREEMESLSKAGAVGNVCGLFFDVNGNPAGKEWQDRSISIKKNDLIHIPKRIAIASGIWKAPAILGAIRGGYINSLVTDSLTAKEILRLEENQPF